MLYIQDPFFSNSYTLHEAIIDKCSPAIEGKGAYAFATKSGIEILLKDEAFYSMLDRGSFSLIVGIDEITNLASLESLNEIKANKPNLDIKAFDHQNRGSLFHPKVSYFKKEDDTGSLIVGSGNLTIGGLRKNREAFSVIDLSRDELQRIELFWNSWIVESEACIKEIDDPSVLKKAEENRYERRARIIPSESEGQEHSREQVITADTNLHEDGWQFYTDNVVLVAEIPQSGNRWKQANFDINTFQNFFGATPGDNNQRIILRNINNDYSLSSIEVRPSVSVASQNYRFELDAATGLLYPVTGRPIGIFIKLTTRMFLYHLFMPNHARHNEINNWLEANWTGRAGRMKRITTTVQEIQDIIENSVFQRNLITDRE